MAPSVWPAVQPKGRTPEFREDAPDLSKMGLGVRLRREPAGNLYRTCDPADHKRSAPSAKGRFFAGIGHSSMDIHSCQPSAARRARRASRRPGCHSCGKPAINKGISNHPRKMIFASLFTIAPQRLVDESGVDSRLPQRTEPKAPR